MILDRINLCVTLATGQQLQNYSAFWEPL